MTARTENVTLDELEKMVAEQATAGPLRAGRIHEALWHAAPELIKIARAVAESGHDWGEDALSVRCWICWAETEGSKAEAIKHADTCAYVAARKLAGGAP